MERSQALKTLRKLIGPDFGYEVNSNAVSPDEREKIKALLPEAVAERNRLSKLLSERHAAILAADMEYQSLRHASKAASERVNELSGRAHIRKIVVGTVSKLFFHVKASGDSWEEVIAKVKKKKEDA